MNMSEVAAILTMCAAVDRRTLGDSDVTTWATMLDDRITFDDARSAVVAWYRDRREWIMPADVNAAVRAMRRDRLEREMPLEPPDADPNDPRAYIAALKADRRRVADGTERPRPVAELIAGAVDRLPTIPRDDEDDVA